MSQSKNETTNSDIIFRSVQLIAVWTLAAISLLYFLPFAIAVTRRKNVMGIFVVNLLTGWTVIGWIVALVMACGERQAQQTVQIIQVKE